MGVNLGGLAYYSTEWAFVDIMKQSSAWMTGNQQDRFAENPFDTGDALSLRPADGYPSALPANKTAHKLMLRNLQLRAQAGRYVCLFDGEGTVDFEFDARVVSRYSLLCGQHPNLAILDCKLFV